MWSLNDFLAALADTAVVYRFGYVARYEKFPETQDYYPLTRKLVLTCFTGITRALDPVEAVYVKRSLHDKSLPARRIIHPRDVCLYLPISGELVDVIVAAAARAVNYDATVRRQLIRVTGVTAKDAMKAFSVWFPPQFER